MTCDTGGLITRGILLKWRYGEEKVWNLDSSGGDIIENGRLMMDGFKGQQYSE